AAGSRPSGQQRHRSCPDHPAGGRAGVPVGRDRRLPKRLRRPPVADRRSSAHGRAAAAFRARRRTRSPAGGNPRAGSAHGAGQLGDLPVGARRGPDLPRRRAAVRSVADRLARRHRSGAAVHRLHDFGGARLRRVPLRNAARIPRSTHSHGNPGAYGRPGAEL
ncbi:MAG: hypothetical protein AVDCRST_MAG44-1590, partial [uncultured Sphingomonas sp.]